MGRDYRDIVANKKRYPVVSRPFHHACDCLSGNVKKQRQSQISSLKAKSSERPVAKMGNNEEGALRVNTKLKKSDKLPFHHQLKLYNVLYLNVLDQQFS